MYECPWCGAEKSAPEIICRCEVSRSCDPQYIQDQECGDREES